MKRALLDPPVICTPVPGAEEIPRELTGVSCCTPSPFSAKRAVARDRAFKKALARRHFSASRPLCLFLFYYAPNSTENDTRIKLCWNPPAPGFGGPCLKTVVSASTPAPHSTNPTTHTYPLVNVHQAGVAHMLTRSARATVRNTAASPWSKSWFQRSPAH